MNFTSACFTLKVMKPLPAEAAGPLLIDPLESYNGHHSLGARLHRKIRRPEGLGSPPFLWKYRQRRGLRLTSARGFCPEAHDRRKRCHWLYPCIEFVSPRMSCLFLK